MVTRFLFDRKSWSINSLKLLQRGTSWSNRCTLRHTDAECSVALKSCSVSPNRKDVEGEVEGLAWTASCSATEFQPNFNGRINADMWGCSKTLSFSPKSNRTNRRVIPTLHFVVHFKKCISKTERVWFWKGHPDFCSLLHTKNQQNLIVGGWIIALWLLVELSN